MKNQISTFIILSLSLLLIGCGANQSRRLDSTGSTNDDGLNSSFYPGDGNSDSRDIYYLSADYCHSNTDDQIVEGRLCASVASTEYYKASGVCYSRDGGGIVNTTLCESNDGGTASNEGFYLSGAECRSRATGNSVNGIYCASVATTDYYEAGGTCYERNSGNVVSSSNCQSYGETSSSGSDNGETAVTCLGVYYYYAGYNQYTPVNCSVYNCSGYNLYNTSGTVVSCQ